MEKRVLLFLQVPTYSLIHFWQRMILAKLLFTKVQQMKYSWDLLLPEHGLQCMIMILINWDFLLQLIQFQQSKELHSLFMLLSLVLYSIIIIYSLNKMNFLLRNFLIYFLIKPQWWKLTWYHKSGNPIIRSQWRVSKSLRNTLFRILINTKHHKPLPISFLFYL